MKKYFKEIIILLIQIIIFYIVPLFAMWNIQTNPMGMVLLMILLTFILSIILSIISKHKIKFLYPLIVSIIFIPSVYIYYNESALIHSVWYLVVSLIGIGIGAIIK